MYIAIDESGRAVSMCNIRQAETDIQIHDPCQDMYDNLTSYVYNADDGEWILDEAYMPPSPPKTRLDLLEDAMQDLILMTMGGE